MKKLLITEKPSVAMEFSKALKQNAVRKNGYLESNEWIITWCVGHLVTMSYPEAYDEKSYPAGGGNRGKSEGYPDVLPDGAGILGGKAP